jgi:hypothetical protein
MKLQFESGKITIQSNASDWGPFTFDFEDAMPSGRTLSACTVTSYLGRVKPDDSDDLASETDTSAELINTVTVSSDYVVSVYFDRPSTTAWVNQKHTLVFNFTLDVAGGSGTHSAYFYYVEVI